MKRALTARPEGGPDAEFGPSVQLTAHVALIPLVRVGAYVGHDVSPMGGQTSARDVTQAGVRVKLLSPWPRGAWRAWVFAGFGYAGIYARSTTATRALISASPGTPPVDTEVTVQGAGGGYFDVPFGLGASYKFRRPWELSAELGVRTGFGHRGSAYVAPGPEVRRAGQAEGNALPSGKDSLAIGLTVGVLVDL